MEQVRLGDVCDILNGFAFKSSEYQKSGIRILRITNVQNGYIEDNEPKYYSIEQQSKIQKYLLKENDLLISLTGNVGRVGLLKRKMLPAALNQRVACLRVKKGKDVSINYIFNILNTKYFEKQCEINSKGIAQKNLSTEWLKKYLINIPNIAEQIEISNKLDKLQKIIDKRKKQIEESDEFVKSQFFEMFGDFKINNKKWNIVNLLEVASIDTNMTKDFKKYAELPHIGIDNIEKNTGNLINYTSVKESNLTSGKYLFDERHIIYSKIRPNLNKVATPDFKGLCSADSYPILTNEKCRKEFLAFVLRSEYFLSYILSYSSRTNIPKVNKEQLGGFNFPLPPIELQDQFADFIKQIDKHRVMIQKALKETEELKESLMDKYFGE